MVTTVCAHCNKEIVITGDGARTFYSHRETGGTYFCNEECKTAWLPRGTLSGVVVGGRHAEQHFSTFDEYADIMKREVAHRD